MDISIPADDKRTVLGVLLFNGETDVLQIELVDHVEPLEFAALLKRYLPNVPIFDKNGNELQGAP